MLQTGDLEVVPTSQQMEKQRVVLDQLRTTLDLPLDKLESLR